MKNVLNFAFLTSVQELNIQPFTMTDPPKPPPAPTPKPFPDNPPKPPKPKQPSTPK